MNTTRDRTSPDNRTRPPRYRLLRSIAAAAIAAVTLGTTSYAAEPTTRFPVEEETPPPVSITITGTLDEPEVTYETTTEPIAFEHHTIEDPNLLQGQTEVRTPGKPGSRTIVWAIVPNKGRPPTRAKFITSAPIEPVHELVAVGTKEPPPPVEEISTTTMWTTAVLNVRSGPSTDDEAVGTLATDTSVQVNGKAGDFYRTTDGTFVAGEYLSTQDPTPPAAAPQASNPATADARGTARQMLAERGWGDDQYTCLENLWQKESGWNHQALNKRSGAYGIPQALPGSKMASAGADWQTNPATQIRWGLDYITGRYGSPCGAWGHAQAKGWY